MTQPQYRNPPIEEAVCEFRFSSDPDRGSVSPELFHERIDDEYPNKLPELKFVEFSLTTRKKGHSPDFQKGPEGVVKHRFATSNEKRLVEIGTNILSIHMLRPYEGTDSAPSNQGGWHEFEQRISKALDVYWQFAEPNGVYQIGIRYINKISLPDSNKGKVWDYLQVASPVDLSKLSELAYPKQFVARAEYTYADGVRLILSHGSSDMPQTHVGFFLDLDIVWKNDEPIAQQNEILEKVNILHNREKAVFEALITDQARGAFR